MSITTGDADPEPAGMEAVLPPAMPFQHTVLRLVLVLWVTALLLGPVAVVRVLSPGRAWSHLPWVVLLVALEGVFTTYWLRRPRQRLLNRSLFRLAEFVLILTVVRLLTWTLAGLPSLAEWRQLLLEPANVLDRYFVGHMLLIGFAWFMAITSAATFYRLDLRPEEVDLKGLQGQERMFLNTRSVDLASFFRQWLNGGLVLVVCAALTTVDLPGLRSFSGLRSLTRLGLPPDVLLGLLLYFGLGLWLLSWARLQVMRVRWLTDKAEVEYGVWRHWLRQSLGLIGLTAILAAFIPVGSTVPIALFISAVVNVVLAIYAFLGGLLLVLAAFLLGLFSFLLGADRPPELDTPQPAESPVAPAPLPAPEPLSETARLITGSVFWLVVVGLVLLLALFYLRERGYHLEGRAWRQAWQRLTAWWQVIWNRVTGRFEQLGQAVQLRLTAWRRVANAGDRSRWRYIRLRGLPPRDRIRYFYLSTVRRATDRGVRRAPATTPSEYAGALKEAWPDAETDLEQLTGAFLQARYDRQALTEEDVLPVQRIWRRVRGRLRRRGRRSG